jgi:trehalose utilization protein
MIAAGFSQEDFVLSTKPIRVTVWGENVHDREHEEVRKVYPQGMHSAIADGLRELLGDQVVVRTATLEQPEHGLTDEVLDDTDVITWWGHMAHGKVADEVVQKVYDRVINGTGLLVLHSGHFSKIFRKLMGTSCALRWREDPNEREIVWTVRPGHPITAGVPQPFIVPHQEMYGEYFDIPQPDELVFISSFSGGEVFRSGCCWTRGQGRVFYFSPGHETFPVYYQPEIRRVLANGVLWAYQPIAEQRRYEVQRCPHAPMHWFDGTPAG